MAQQPTMGAAYLAEFEPDMAGTRRMLERVPHALFDWRPHAKSMTMGELAGHIVDLIGWAPMVVERDGLDLAAVPQDAMRPNAAGSTADLLSSFDAKLAAARAAVSGASDEQLTQAWSLRHGEQVILTLPRIGVLKGSILKHIIHHRGQLSVYLRLNDIPVPGVYGPSADDKGA